MKSERSGCAGVTSCSQGLRLAAIASLLVISLLASSAVLAGDAPAEPQPALPRADPPSATATLSNAQARLRDAPAALWQALETRDYARALDLLAAMEARWAMDASYNALVAETALAARDFAQATLALERLVLLAPGNAGAWLDLAVASEALGDLEGAQRALVQLEGGFDLPPGIRPIVAALRERLAATRPESEPRFSLRAGAFVGRDSNANGGLLTNTLTLTSPLASIELPVDPAFLPRASSFWMGTLEAAGRWSGSSGPFEARARLSDKRYASEPDYNTVDGSVSLAGAMPGTRGAYWLLDWRHIALGAGLLSLEIPRLAIGTGIPWRPGACEPSLGAELELRSYREPRALYDARIVWLAAGLRCPLAAGRLSAVARWGDDQAAKDRPGGDTRRAELLLAWQRLLRPGLELTLGAQAAHAVDSVGYSPLLENNAPRRADRLAARAELAWQLQERWQLIARVEHIRQSSNIGLFALRQGVATLGLVYQMP